MWINKWKEKSLILMIFFQTGGLETCWSPVWAFTFVFFCRRRSLQTIRKKVCLNQLYVRKTNTETHPWRTIPDVLSLSLWSCTIPNGSFLHSFFLRGQNRCMLLAPLDNLYDSDTSLFHRQCLDKARTWVTWTLTFVMWWVVAVDSQEKNNRALLKSCEFHVMR